VLDQAIKSGDEVYHDTTTGLTGGGVATTGRVATTFTADANFAVAGVPRLTSVASAGALVGHFVKVELTCGPSPRALAPITSGLTTTSRSNW
jgi:hypothetical protein